MGRFFKILAVIIKIVAFPITAIRWLVFTGFALLIFFSIFIAAMQPKPGLPRQAALVIDPVGVIVEQGTQLDPADELLNDIFGGGTVPETELQDILDALESAATDNRIDAVVLSLDNMLGAGPSTMHRIAAAIEEFKESGKPVYAIGNGYGDQQYLLASHANEIIMHPFGGVFITGYGRYRNYYREMLERIEVNVNVFRVGTFKSAVEPYIRDDMSEPAREANLAYLSILWDNYTASVESARGFTQGTISDGIENIIASMEAAGGDFGQAALDLGLVDSLMYTDEYRAHIAEVVGTDSEHGSFNQVSLHDYMQHVDTSESQRGPQVAVITAAGVIVDGEAPAGTVGGETIARLIREARMDGVSAIVLRVDSPGGSAFASEVIRRELVVSREAGIPVVVSMGDLAASGGYWISTASDEIWASPTTITGSIGIFGMIPTFEDTLAMIGVHRDGVGTTELSDGLDVFQTINPTLANLIQQSIENGYDDFIARVMEARGMTYEEVDAIAQGRVWAGATALDLGLVDRLGELEDAIASAAEMAGLEDYAVHRYHEEPLSIWEQLAESFSSQASAAFGIDDGVSATALPDPVSEEMARVWADWRLMTQLNDPNHAYVLCLECTTLTQ